MLTQFIKDVYLDSQVTVGPSSNVPASVVDSPGEGYRAPKNIRQQSGPHSLRRDPHRRLSALSSRHQDLWKR